MVALNRDEREPAMDHMRHHLKHMAIAAAIVLVVLAVAGVDLGQAFRSAAILACPLGMIGMMFMMGGHRGWTATDDSDVERTPRHAPHH
jgi:hypothetical protein